MYIYKHPTRTPQQFARIDNLKSGTGEKARGLIEEWEERNPIVRCGTNGRLPLHTDVVVSLTAAVVGSIQLAK